MSRQQALNVIWKRLLLVLLISLATAIAVLTLRSAPWVGILIFVVGNIGGYVSVHRGLGDLKDQEVVDLASSWWAIVVPPFVGGLLAEVLYLLFLSNILAGDLFPRFDADKDSPVGLGSILTQHGREMADYGKLLFWSFVAGFNQKYVVDIINSVRSK